MLFENAYEEYKIYASKRHKKQSFDCLLYNFNSNIYSFFKGYMLENINLNSILKWQDFIISKDFSNNHNKNLFAMLKDFLYFCSISYDYDFTIFSFVPRFPLKIEKKKVDFYTYREFKSFIKYVDNIVYKTFFNFMYFVGTRPGEVLALKFSDLNGNYITINKTIDSHFDRSVGTPKTFSSNRTIEIDNKLILELLSLKEYYIDKYCDSNFDYYIFGGDKPLAPTTINRYKLSACKKAGIRPITLHQFRHSLIKVLMFML